MFGYPLLSYRLRFLSQLIDNCESKCDMLTQQCSVARSNVAQTAAERFIRLTTVIVVVIIISEFVSLSTVFLDGSEMRPES